MINHINKKAIVFTANTPHVAQANLMLASLRDPARGNFQGDVWVISTGLSRQCQLVLDGLGVKFLINPLSEMDNWQYRDQVAREQPEYVNGMCGLDEAFDSYRNKRMSKLIVLDWIEKFGDCYDTIVLCDNDLYFQRDINDLFLKSERDKDVLWYWQEEYENLPGSYLWTKDSRYRELHDATGLDFGVHEINIGFIMSTPDVMRRVFARVKELFTQCNSTLFAHHSWHDQDLVRLVRAQTPELFRLFDEGNILHLCNGGDTVAEERFPMDFFHRKTGQRVTVIHFAGGVWKAYPSVEPSYRVEAGQWFCAQERLSAFDSVRAKCDWDPFDQETVYFTAHNANTRQKARESWLQTRKKSSKKSMLFFTWLDTGSHKPLRDLISEFLLNDVFDLAIIDGNCRSVDHAGLSYEDLPDVLTHVTRFIRDNDLALKAGYVRDDVPEDAIAGAMASLCHEYSCTARHARALANIAYRYLKSAIGFYAPDAVLCWGAYLFTSRITKAVCNELGVPFMTMELSVLPRTIAFDVMGHMGESRVARYAEEFNALPLSEKDVGLAREYLASAECERFSRNRIVAVPDYTRARLQRIRRSGKRVVLYVGSNCAHSGNVPFDDHARQYHSPHYSYNNAVVHALSEAFNGRDDLVIIYKPHPISITRGLDLDRQYGNIEVITDANLDDCLEIADLVVVKVSQASYEAVLRGKPVLMVGVNQINESGAVYVLNEPGCLGRAVDEALSRGLTDSQRNAFVAHVARLLKYYAYDTANARYGRPLTAMAGDMNALLDGTAPDYLRRETEALSVRGPTPKVCSGEPAISVIMPVFNGERYLSDCIVSILKQRFGDFELICVNNGSKDGSQEIIDHFARHDSRVISCYQSEPNQCKARNAGVEMARGKYIHFVDCDDLLHPDAYGYLHAVAEANDAEMIYFFFNELYATATIGRPRFEDFGSYFPEEDLFRLERLHVPLFAQYPFPWAKLFRKKFLVENRLFFDLDCINFDDNPQNLRSLLSAKRIFVAKKRFYYFRINRDSMTQSVNARVMGMIDAVRIMNDLYRQNGCYEEFQKFYVPYKIHLLCFAWTKLPAELRCEYLGAFQNLFLPGDRQCFRFDSMRSVFTYLEEKKIRFVESVLDGLYDAMVADGSILSIDPYLNLQTDGPGAERLKTSGIDTGSMPIQYIRLKWANLKHERGIERAAVMGTGTHTRWLATVVSNVDGPEVVALLDEKQSGIEIFGLQVEHPEKFDSTRVDAIILSTAAFQREMTERCQKYYGANVKLVDLYDGLRKDAFPFSIIKL